MKNLSKKGFKNFNVSAKLILNRFYIDIRARRDLYVSENGGKLREFLFKNQTRVSSSRGTKCSSKSPVKVPRLLRKNGDKDRIKQYCLVKELCLNEQYEKAISIVEKLFEFQADSASSILILNGLLYSLLQQKQLNYIKKVMGFVDRRGIKGDRSTYTVMIDSLAQMKDSQMVDKLLDEMGCCGIQPHYRSYLVATQLNLDEKQFSNALKHFLKIESIYMEDHDEFCASVLSAFAANQQFHALHHIYDYFAKYRTRLGVRTLVAIQESFLKHYGWNSVITQVSSSGECQCCKEMLQEVRFGKPEQHLSDFFRELLQADSSSKETYSKDLQKLEEFIDENGPYTVVIDGLNVAMRPQFGLDFDPLFKVVEACSSKGEQILIIAANELISPKRSKTVSASDHQRALSYLNTVASIFFVKHNNSGVDDLYLINAALYLCRKDFNVRLISNDKFLDHQVKMKPPTLNYFKRWLEDHQITLRWFDRTRMKALPPKRRLIERSVQKSTDSWHFPSTDKNTWLCVKLCVH